MNNEFLGRASELDEQIKTYNKDMQAEKGEKPVTPEFELQPVWRTLSKTEGSGFFVWYVVEVVGESTMMPDLYFLKCRDGSLIFIQCSHFFAEKSAQEYLHDNEYSEYQLVTVV